MKKFLLLSLLGLGLAAHTAVAFDIPARPQGFVSDYAGVFSAENKAALENKISSFEKQTTNEIAVVTIPSLDGDTVENVAQNIFTAWGIGQKDKNNGVLILVALAEHKTRIQTGYGVEGDLTDLATSYIQSDIMTPAFRAGDYYGGVNGAVDKIITALHGENIVPKDYQKSSQIPWSLIVFLIFVILNIILSRKKRRMWIFPWWGGGGPGGSSGGGFGGFGGGASGGGGSSGSW